MSPSGWRCEPLVLETGNKDMLVHANKSGDSSTSYTWHTVQEDK